MSHQIKCLRIARERACKARREAECTRDTLRVAHADLGVLKELTRAIECLQRAETRITLQIQRVERKLVRQRIVERLAALVKADEEEAA